jgi:hypothetical protein
MCPLFINGELCAILELARADHPFRGSDAATLAGIAYTASCASLGSA